MADLKFNTEVSFTLEYKVTKIVCRLHDGSYRLGVKVISFDGYPKKAGFPREFDAIGTYPIICIGDTFKSTARIAESKYGYFFQLHSPHEQVLPSSEKEVAKYLSSHIRGLGAKCAQDIVHILGPSAITKIPESPECLNQLPNITKRKKEAIVEWCRNNIYCEKVLLYLQQHNVPLDIAKSLYDRYGTLTISKLNENPYAAYESGNIPFRFAEHLAFNLGFLWSDKNRLQCAVRAAIDDRIDSHGDTCVLKDKVIQIAEHYIAKSPYYLIEDGCCRNEAYIFEPKEYEDAIQHLLDTGELIKYARSKENGGNVYYYRKATYHQETVAAERVVKMIQRRPPISTSKKQILRYLDAQHHSLVQDQSDAVIMVATHGVSVLTGGPGTGKTFAVQAIVDTLRHFRPTIRIVQVAPTAKAAAKMREMTGLDSNTVHSVFKLGVDNMKLDPDFILEADMVIVDESSMIGAQLFELMLQRLSSDCSMLLVGDPAQLPSVDCGDVLRGLCMSKVVPMTELKTIHRQSLQSTIVRNAHRIRSGEASQLSQLELHTDDFHFKEIQKEDEVSDFIVDTVAELVLKRHVMLDDILVLTPVHATLCGTDVLNTRLQELLTPYREGDPEYVVNEMRSFRVHDRVVNTRNFTTKDVDEKKLRVKNGDIGVITSISETTMDVFFECMDTTVTYQKSEIQYLDLAYVMTVHKSQGSEADYVIVPFVKTPKFLTMMKRPLIYTAITRAKKHFIGAGNPQVLINGCNSKMSLEEKRSSLRTNDDIRTSLFSVFLRKAYFCSL